MIAPAISIRPDPSRPPKIHQKCDFEANCLENSEKSDSLSRTQRYERHQKHWLIIIDLVRKRINESNIITYSSEYWAKTWRFPVSPSALECMHFWKTWRSWLVQHVSVSASAKKVWGLLFSQPAAKSLRGSHCKQFKEMLDMNATRNTGR